MVAHAPALCFPRPASRPPPPHGPPLPQPPWPAPTPPQPIPSPWRPPAPTPMAHPCPHPRPPQGMEADEFVESMKRKGLRVPGIGHRIKSRDNRDKRVELLQL